MDVRYYSGSVVDHDYEVSAKEALALPAYTRASLGSEHQLEKAEYVVDGKLKEVNYYHAASSEVVRASHRRAYPGIPYVIWEALGAANGYVWKFVSFFSSVGKLTGYRKLLIDDKHREWMQLDIDPSHRVVLITKYVWQDDGELTYVFEYGADGALVDAFDVMHGERASYQEVRAELPDPEFYAQGYRLPQTFAATAIPGDPG